jgi:hypothetical protein
MGFYDQERERLLGLVPPELKEDAMAYLDRRYEIHSYVDKGMGFIESKERANQDLEKIIIAGNWFVMYQFLYRRATGTV